MDRPLPTPAEMAEWDRLSIEAGIRPEMLMENASREVASALLEEYGEVAGRSVLLLAGPGNNGGDAFAVARHLRDRGARVRVLHSRPRGVYKGAAGYHLRLAARLGVDMAPLRTGGLEQEPTPDIVVDGLLGTGFRGSLRPEYAGWIEAVNRMGVYVLAIDIPSGLDGLTGRPSPIAVRADLTATFEEAKLGLAMPGAAKHTGKLVVRRIGIPRTVREARPPTHFGITEAVFSLLPGDQPDMHKGRAGHVLVVGGSGGLTGAPLLSALGALRAGSGLVTVACPGGIAAEVKAGVPDVMTMPLGSGETWEPAVVGRLAGELERFDAVVCGPGLGRDEETAAFLRAFLGVCRLPAVLDADALYHLARDTELLEEIKAPSVLTPHPGEMARLVSRRTSEIVDSRIEVARGFAGATGHVVVLKGPGTVVADPGGEVRISPVVSPNLAVGGSGDILSGVVGCLLGRGLSPLPAACLGVYWHGLCGTMLARDFPRRGNLARDIADALPVVLKELIECARL